MHPALYFSLTRIKIVEANVPVESNNMDFKIKWFNLFNNGIFKDIRFLRSLELMVSSNCNDYNVKLIYSPIYEQMELNIYNWGYRLNFVMKSNGFRQLSHLFKLSRFK